MKYDVVIVGASFSGLAVAYHLPKEYKIFVIDKKRALNAGVESTGLITSATKNLLAGFTDIEKFLPNKINTIAVVSPDYDKHFFSTDKDPWIYSTDTPNLLAYMAENTPNNVSVEVGCDYKARIINEKEEYPVKITYTKEHKEHEVKAKFLVGADGAHSSVARHNKSLSTNYKFLAGLEKVFYGDIIFGDHPRNTVYHFWFGAFSLGYGGWLSPTIIDGKHAFRVGLAKLSNDIHQLKKLDDFIEILLDKKIITINGSSKKHFFIWKFNSN